VFLIVLQCFSFGANASCRLTFSNGVEVYPVLLAHTEVQQRVGLSGRESVNEGMLFVWSRASQRQFWMRNTHVTLQLYFLDEQANITEQVALVPMSEQRHYSEVDARYALELPLPMAKDSQLSVGVSLESVLCE
jgi:hypothetical protein